jgi:uncharacterized NAD-dependent epimerase/dehydratase family protein
MRGLPGRALPDLAEAVSVNEAAARVTNPRARCVGIAMNTSNLAPGRAEAALDEAADRLGLPCVDPVATGVGPIVDRLET